MKNLRVLLFCAGLALFSLGCGGSAAPPTEAEVEKLNSQMDADMEKMTGQLGSNPDDPGAGKTPAAAPGTE